MLHLYDRATMALALTLDLDPGLRARLVSRINALVTEYGDLTDHTEFLIVEPDDDEADIIRAIGFSPLVEPTNGRRFGGEGFYPFWDWLGRHEHHWEMIVTFGSTFAYVLIIEDDDSMTSAVQNLCRFYSLA